MCAPGAHAFHVFRRDPATQWGFTSRSSIFLSRIDPRVKLTAMGRGGGAEGRTQRARWSLMEPYGATDVGLQRADNPWGATRQVENPLRWLCQSSPGPLPAYASPIEPVVSLLYYL